LGGLACAREKIVEGETLTPPMNRPLTLPNGGEGERRKWRGGIDYALQSAQSDRWTKDRPVVLRRIEDSLRSNGMNEQDRAELESLKERQGELLRQTTALAEQLRGKELLLEGARRDLQQLRSTQASLEQARLGLGREIAQLNLRLSIPATAPGASVLPPAIPSVVPQAPRLSQEQAPEPILPPIIPAVPPVIPRTEAAAQMRSESTLRTTAHASADILASPRTSSEGSEATSPGRPAPPPPPPPPSFELRLGTYWLVRVGIVMLLTGVVFLGTYAYKNWVGQLGPAGKVTLLYLMSGTLLGLGSWLYRKQEALKNYAQVLFAGGLAAAYFTTYGAHHIPGLRIISSAVVDGALLLGWAGYVVWLADRRKSEVLALFAVGLAFYSSVMTQVGLFTLYSNLILTITAVFFLVRNRWVTLSVASLFASYGGYVFWRFYHGGDWRWATPDEGLWKGVYFLMSYWVIFTAAVFTTKDGPFTGKNRAGFLTLNNGAFFTLFLLTMLQVRHGGFWKFALVYGTVLLALAIFSWWSLRDDKVAANAYLTQGLVLVTIGFVTYFGGLKLALVLATESIMLSLATRFISSRIMQLGAYASGILSVWFAVTTMVPDVRGDLIIGAFIGTAMIFNAAVSRRQQNENVELTSTILFTVLALVVWFVTTWQQAHGQWRGLALAIESLVFVLASRPLRNFALRHGALPYAAVAVGWSIYTMNRAEPLGLYVGLAIGAVVLLDDLLCDEDAERGLAEVKGKQLFSTLALVIWFVTTWVFTPPEHRAAIVAAEGLLFLLAHRLVDVKPLTIGGMVFIFIAQIVCLFNLLPKASPASFPLWATVELPWWNPVVVGVIGIGVAHWAQRQKRISLQQSETSLLQLFCVLPVLGILFFWFQPAFSPQAWLAFTAVLGIIVTAYSVATRLWVLAAAAQIFVWYSALQFLRLAVVGPEPKPFWSLALAPVAALLVLSLATGLFRSVEHRPWLSSLGLFYRGTAIAISVLWVFAYITTPHQIWVFALLGACCFAGNVVKRSRELLVISAVYTGSAHLLLWARMGSPDMTFWPNLLVVIALLAQQVVAQAEQDRFQIPRETQVGAIVLGLAGLWLWVSKWVSDEAGGFYLTATWAALALLIFGAGFLLKEKMYRWSGLVILTCALGRVVILDVWRLETIYRILSFMALGIVLLVLGFVYTKFQNKIREWL
jgi:hypothetical protein